MPEISNNRISFNNRTYDIKSGSANTNTDANSISQKFAESLKKAGEDNNISSEELTVLKSISDSGNSAEKEIVLALSGAGTALLDSNPDDTIVPVQITFGDPAARKLVSATQPPASSKVDNIAQPSTPKTYEMSLPYSYRTAPYKISDTLYNYFNTAVAGSGSPKISYEEFEQLKKISESSKNLDDINFVTDLASLAITKIDAKNKFEKKINIKTSDGKTVSIEVDNTPPKVREQGASSLNLKSLLETIVQKTTNVVSQVAMDAYNKRHPNATVALPVKPFVFTSNPQGFTPTLDSAITNDNKFHLNLGVQYTTNSFNEMSLTLQASYGTALFGVPSFLNNNSGAYSYKSKDGFNLTASVNVGKIGKISYNTNTGFQAAANIPVSKNQVLAVSYNQVKNNQGGLSIGMAFKLPGKK